MKIKVTQKDIDKAYKILQRKNGSKSLWASDECDFDAEDFERSCPISQALRKKTKKRIETGEEYICIDEKYYYVTQKIKNFIKRFDSGKKVKPFAFKLISD